jgi:LysR family nitrogen assimilation transcriptional regulator
MQIPEDTMNVLDSRKLWYFVEVARARSFRLAAISIGISQSVLTRQVQSLEEELGVVLLQRGIRSTTTTEAGEILLERSQKILGELEATRALLSSVGVTPTGLVTIAMLTSFSASFSSALLKNASEAMPEVRIRTTEGNSRYVEERLVHGLADVGILMRGPFAERFICEDLLEEEFCLFGQSFPDPERPWTMPEIAALPLVLPLPPYGTRGLIDEAARRAGVRLSARFEVDSPYLVRDLISSHGIYAILPRLSLAQERKAGLLQAVPIADAPRRTVAIATLNGKPLSTAARGVAQIIRRTVTADLPDGPAL